MDLGKSSIIQPRNLLLLDGIGAMASAIMLGGVLIYFQEQIGMPKHILYALALAATCFAAFSLTNYYRKSSNAKSALKMIGIINILYCIVSLALVIQYYPLLTLLGVGYFILEKMVVLLLALMEIKASQN